MSSVVAIEATATISPIDLDRPSTRKRQEKRKRSKEDLSGRKARQAEKNRQTARRFRDKMISLRDYLDDQVVSLTTTCRILMMIMTKPKPHSNDNKRGVNSTGMPVRRARTSHI